MWNHEENCQKPEDFWDLKKRLAFHHKVWIEGYKILWKNIQYSSSSENMVAKFPTTTLVVCQKCKCTLDVVETLTTKVVVVRSAKGLIAQQDTMESMGNLSRFLRSF